MTLGTVRVNRKGMPKAFPLVHSQGNEAIFRRKANLLAIKFHEKRDVHMISTCHKATFKICNKRHQPNQVVVKPSVIVDYCKHMGGVDLSDQML